jgi:hypothetical protein
MSIERIKDLISKIEKEEYIINENYYDLNLDSSEKNDLSYNHKVYKNVKNYVGNFADKQQRFQQLIDPMLTGPVNVEEIYCMVGDIKEFANKLYELSNKQGIILKDIEIKNSSYITKNIKNGCYIASTDENYDILQTNNREFIFKFEKNKNFSILVGVEMNLTVNKNTTYDDISDILTKSSLGNDITIIPKNKTNPNSSNNSNDETPDSNSPDETPDSNSLINSNNKKINIEFELRLVNNIKK